MTVTVAGGRYVLNVATVNGEAAIANRDLGKVSANNVVGAQFFTSGTAWWVSLTNAQGDKAVAGYKFSAAGGLAQGVCTSAVG